MLRSEALPAPIKGWNTRDSAQNMMPGFAQTLDNWFPSLNNVSVRKGVTAHVTGFTNPVKTLMAWRGPSSSKLFAACNNGIFDATSAGAVGAAVSSITEGDCVFVNYNTTGGSFLIVVNATDNLRYYNGTTWTTIASFAISGGGSLLTNTIAHVNVFKRSLFFVAEAEMAFYFLPIDSITGTVSRFPVGALFDKGGYLMATATWTMDGGSGSDDYTVLISSEGQVALYKGTDPSSAATWELRGVYNFAAPKGRKCSLKYGGDLLLLSALGVFSMNSALAATQITVEQTLSRYIAPSFRDASISYGANNGWQLFHFPQGSLLFANIPVTANGASWQFVMNTESKAWCRFTGLNAICWEQLADTLYVGTDDSVGLAWQAGSDFGDAIQAEAVGAYTYLSPRARKKLNALIQPVLKFAGQVSASVGGDTDFGAPGAYTAVVTNSTNNYVWNASTSTWDTATYGDEPTTQLDWVSIAAKEFYALAPRLRVFSGGDTVEWFATNLLYEVGALQG